MRFQTSLTSQKKRSPPAWVFKKPENVAEKDLSKATTTKNVKQYKWCTLCNNGKGAWQFHWNTGHSAWTKQHKEGGAKVLCIQEPSRNTVMVEDEDKDEEADDFNYFITICSVGHK